MSQLKRNLAIPEWTSCAAGTKLKSLQLLIHNNSDGKNVAGRFLANYSNPGVLKISLP